MTNRKLQPGQPIRAISSRTWNRFVDASDMVLEGHLQARSNDTFGRAQLMVDNQTGTDIECGWGVGIGTASFGPSDNLSNYIFQHPMDAEDPNEGTHAGGRWGVAEENIPNGQAGRVLMVGITYAVIAGGDWDKDHTHVNVGPGGPLLSGTSGEGLLLHSESFDGKVHGIVKLGGGGAASCRRGQPASEHPSGEQRDYAILDETNTPVAGATVTGVWNMSLVTFQTTAVYYLFNCDGEWFAHPSQFDTCHPNNPQVVT